MGSPEINATPGALADVIAELDTRYPALARLTPICSYLVNGTRLDTGDQVPPGVTLDVLPPFAGG